jgi:hypothetical protein
MKAPICWLVGHRTPVTPDGYSPERLRQCPRCRLIWFRWRDDGFWREWP